MQKQLVLWGCLILLACCRPVASQQVVTGDVLLTDEFNQAYHWDAFAQQQVEVGVQNGAYAMRSNVKEYVLGRGLDQYTDVVIEVSSRQFSTFNKNAYGIICRASSGNSGSGYYFLIGGDGSYSIRKGRDQKVDALVSWAHSGVIHWGQSRNLIRVVCVDDYLALYANGEFVTEVRDSTYQSGYVGFVVAVAEGGVIDVTFDNLIIREAALK